MATSATAVGVGVLTRRLAGRKVGHLSGYRSSEGKRRYLGAYEAVLARWPVAYQELTVSTIR